jgi:MHS family proline/betaine transporter-like MFS transporter
VIGGGLGPYLATWLIAETGDNFVPAYLLIGAGLLGLAVVGLTVKANSDPSSHLYR